MAEGNHPNLRRYLPLQRQTSVSRSRHCGRSGASEVPLQTLLADKCQMRPRAALSSDLRGLRKLDPAGASWRSRGCLHRSRKRPRVPATN